MRISDWSSDVCSSDLLADREFLVLTIEDRETVAGNRAPGAAMTRAGVAKSDAGAKRRPAELGLPPMVDDRKAEHRLGPAQRVGIGALAGKIKRAKAAYPLLGEEAALGILALYRADRGRPGEEDIALVIANGFGRGSWRERGGQDVE